MTVPPRFPIVHVPVETTRMVAAVAVAALLLLPSTSLAHCDTLDGPVVKVARVALETKDIRPVLAWVKPGHEDEVRAAFSRVLEVRRTARSGRGAADREFFETVVRIHRAGEGAAFTGLKPAGAGVGTAVQAADRAIEAGEPFGVEQAVVEAVRDGVRQRFARLGAHEPPGDDVAEGRAWVAAYVDYVHYVERVELLARASDGSDHAESPGSGADASSASAPARSTHAHQH